MACRQAKLLLLLLASSALLEAQEVRVVDLLNVNQRTELRFPPAPSDCIPSEPCVGGGVGGGSVADGAPDPRDPRASGIALDRVTPTNITLDAFEVECRVLNTGLVPINVPSLAALERTFNHPRIRSRSHISASLSKSASLVLAQCRRPVSGGLNCTGLRNVRTIITLKPGEWVRVRATMKLHTWPTTPIEGAAKRRFLVA